MYKLVEIQYDYIFESHKNTNFKFIIKQASKQIYEFGNNYERYIYMCFNKKYLHSFWNLSSQRLTKVFIL